MANLSKQKRDQMIEFLEHLKKQHKDDDKSLAVLNEIQTKLNEKKYGLVWEEHSEQVDEEMKTKIPVFTLDSSKTIKLSDSSDCNFLLEGDNLHSLTLLEKTHKGKIDVIYIDPPYNRGEDDFIYSDNYIDSVDNFKHSKWLSFMKNRLVIAKKLLSKIGNIFISIDHHELAQLKLLCDEIFGEEKFVDIFNWKRTSTPSNLDKKSKKSIEYVLCYTNCLPEFKFKGLSKNSESSNGLMNQPNSPHDLVFPPNKIDTALKDGVYKAGKYGTKSYEIILKKDTKVKDGYFIQPVHLFGKFKWNQEYLDEAIKSGIKVSIRTKAFSPSYEKKEYDAEVPWNLIDETFGVQTNENASAHLTDILIVNDFDYPKPVSLIKYLINFNNGNTILDFFAGSGTTGEAVMELNNDLKTSKKFILCTDNTLNAFQLLKFLHSNNLLLDYNPDKSQVKQSVVKNKIQNFLNDNPSIVKKIFGSQNKSSKYGICEWVTYPRLKTVITGIRQDGSKYSNGIKSNLLYYKTNFVEKESDELSQQLNEHIKEMIQLEIGEIITNEEYPIILSDNDADELESNITKYKYIKKIYIANDVMLTAKQKKLFGKYEIKIIPDNYFEFELREQGEIF